MQFHCSSSSSSNSSNRNRNRNRSSTTRSSSSSVGCIRGQEEWCLRAPTLDLDQVLPKVLHNGHQRTQRELSRGHQVTQRPVEGLPKA